MSDTFSLDLSRGQIAEQLWLNRLLITWPEAIQIEGYFREYDIIIPDVAKFEVKHDEVSNKTNNYFIEFEDAGNPSGINHTTADFWVEWDGIEWCVVYVKELKQLIKDNNFKIYEGKANNNNRNMKGYLIPKPMLRALHKSYF